MSTTVKCSPKDVSISKYNLRAVCCETLFVRTLWDRTQKSSRPYIVYNCKHTVQATLMSKTNARSPTLTRCAAVAIIHWYLALSELCSWHRRSASFHDRWSVYFYIIYCSNLELNAEQTKRRERPTSKDLYTRMTSRQVVTMTPGSRKSGAEWPLQHTAAGWGMMGHAEIGNRARNWRTPTYIRSGNGVGGQGQAEWQHKAILCVRASVHALRNTAAYTRRKVTMTSNVYIYSSTNHWTSHSVGIRSVANRSASGPGR